MLQMTFTVWEAILSVLVQSNFAENLWCSIKYDAFFPENVIQLEANKLYLRTNKIANRKLNEKKSRNDVVLEEFLKMATSYCAAAW